VADWYIGDDIRAVWRDAPSNDAALIQILETAKAQIIEFDNGATWRRDPANVDADGNPIPWPGAYGSDLPLESGEPTPDVPANLLLAQRTQARNLWNASRVDPSNGTAGDDTFTVRPYPLDWAVKAMIRPKRVLGALG